MSNKTKNIVVSILFISTLILFFILNLLNKDTEISITERRKLNGFPEINFNKIISGSFSNEFDNYVTDQIIQRDNFLQLKSNLELKLFQKKDNNNLYLYKNSIIKIEYPLNEKSVLNATKKINEIQKNYLKGMKCYYSIIPDKNYFTNQNEYIRIDYKKLELIMKQNLQNVQYINIFDCLSLDDYYLTDIHWKQENLQNVVNKIGTEMNFIDRLTLSFNKNYITSFDGTYSGQIRLKNKKDIIYNLTNKVIDEATVYNYEDNIKTQIYNIEKLTSYDKYDIYLSGATPLITITNKNCKYDKELIVFRDSFSSSLVPLFTEAYSKITLIDTRYIKSKDIANYIEFNKQDVLFIYSTTILNNSSILK